MRCKEQVKHFHNLDITRESLLNEGHYVRTAAVNDNGRVKVWFRNKDRGEKQYHMKKDTYRSIPLLEPATIDDYKQQGELTEII